MSEASAAASPDGHAANGERPGLRRRVQERAVDLGFGAAWRIGRAVPARPALAVARRIADRSVRRDAAGVGQLRLNLRRVLGPDAAPERVEDAVRGAMRSYARYWVETFRLPSIGIGQVLANTEIEGFERVTAAVEAGRGAVLALPHSGNWETAGAYLIARGIPFTTVAERLRPEALYRRFLRFRESLGMSVLPLTGGPPTAPLLADVLSRGGVVCLLADRALGEGGLPVTLFGEEALLPPGPALLAERSGAALLPVGCSFAPAGWRVRVGELLEAPAGNLSARTRALTQQLAAQFESHIRDHPADWHMLQRVWSADRRPDPQEAAR